MSSPISPRSPCTPTSVTCSPTCSSDSSESSSSSSSSCSTSTSPKEWYTTHCLVLTDIMRSTPTNATETSVIDDLIQTPLVRQVDARLQCEERLSELVLPSRRFDVFNTEASLDDTSFGLSARQTADGNRNCNPPLSATSTSREDIPSSLPPPLPLLKLTITTSDTDLSAHERTNPPRHEADCSNTLLDQQEKEEEEEEEEDADNQKLRNAAVATTVSEHLQISPRSARDSSSSPKTARTRPKPRRNQSLLYQPWKTTSQNLRKERKGETNQTETPVPTHTLIVRRRQRNQKILEHAVNHLRITLVPLIAVDTGVPHPQFPRSILQYHLLTDEQLDSLALWYHQTVDSGLLRWMYPVTIEKTWTSAGQLRNLNDDIALAHRLGVELQHVLRSVRDRKANVIESKADLATKRRRFGRFIGLRGCESPIVPNTSVESVVVQQQQQQQQQPLQDRDTDAGTIADEMERQWLEALRRAEEERRMQEKCWRGHF